MTLAEIRLVFRSDISCPHIIFAKVFLEFNTDHAATQSRLRPMDAQERPKDDSVKSTPSQAGPDLTLFSPQERLSIPFPLRITLGGFMGFLGGASIGAAHGGKMAGMRFRAEHAHIFPTTTPGWYLYHKSKNYHAMLGAVKQGLKVGGKISIWATGFLAIEETVDRWRGDRDFMSTVVAGLSVAGGFSFWSMTQMI